MGLLDKMKGVGKEMGIGLNANEQYNRAYQKGVLLQPPNYSEAAKQFVAASEKYLKEGNQGMAQRAQANALLYELVATGNQTLIPDTLKALEPLPEIERLGSQTEMVPTNPITVELTALSCEIQANKDENNENKVQKYREASTTLYKLGSAPLTLTEKLKLSGPVDKALVRASYCGALADYHNALCVLMESPAEAEDCLNKAKIGFQQALTQDWSTKVGNYIEQVHSNRYCWMCNRKMQGEDIFYRYYPARIEKYHTNLIGNLKQDGGMVDKPGSVTLCTVCGSAIENQADKYATLRANEVREWAAPIFENHNQRINDLVDAVNRLNSRSHTH